MTALFNDRERAEEYGFAHAEELRFLAARDGTAVLAAWAAERMGGGDYAATLTSVLLTDGIGAVAVRARDDLAGAGQHEAASMAGGVLERAVTEAYARLHDIAAAPVATAAPLAPASTHQRHGF